MISKTSFFNKGIYKSTVKRYLWGAILYFIMLFFTTSLQLFLGSGYEYIGFSDYHLIFSGSYFTLPILFVLIVPTVASLLIFRFIHSKKQSVFIHSLPLSRNSIFISSLLAGLTLMIVPIILNGGILMIASLCKYKRLFSVLDCLKWIGFNSLGIFMMFSCAVLASVMTGNTFAMIGINGLIHGCLVLVALYVSQIAEIFVYGYDSSGAFLSTFIQNNFCSVIYEFSNTYFRESLSFYDYAVYIGASVALYAVSFVLYKKRRMETTGDVAGFKCLNPVFKYLVTTMSVMICFVIFSGYLESNPILCTAIIAITGVLTYFVAEMLLKKTMNVAYSWKGITVFAVIFAGIVTLISTTSILGYETRVPKLSDIREVAVYEYYTEKEPYSSNKEIIKTAREIHRELVGGEIPILNDGFGKSTRIHIKYNLKNGKTISRNYWVSSRECENALNRLYSVEEYKKLSEAVFIDESRITRIYVDKADEVVNNKNVDNTELLEVLRKDILSLSYTDIHGEDECRYRIGIEYEVKYDDETYLRAVQLQITGKYNETLKWIESHNLLGETEEMAID